MLARLIWRTIWLPFQVGMFILRTVLCVSVYSLAAYGTYTLWKRDTDIDVRLVADRFVAFCYGEPASSHHTWWLGGSYATRVWSVLGW